MSLDEKDINGEPLYGVEVLRIGKLSPVHEFDDLAEEYSIRLEPEAASGLLVYARYERIGWKCNPWSTRPLIRELLRRLGIEM